MIEFAKRHVTRWMKNEITYIRKTYTSCSSFSNIYICHHCIVKDRYDFVYFVCCGHTVMIIHPLDLALNITWDQRDKNNTKPDDNVDALLTNIPSNVYKIERLIGMNSHTPELRGARRISNSINTHVNYCASAYVH